MQRLQEEPVASEHKDEDELSLDDGPVAAESKSVPATTTTQGRGWPGEEDSDLEEENETEEPNISNAAARNVIRLKMRELEADRRVGGLDVPPLSFRSLHRSPRDRVASPPPDPSDDYTTQNVMREAAQQYHIGDDDHGELLVPEIEMQNIAQLRLRDMRDGAVRLIDKGRTAGRAMIDKHPTRCAFVLTCIAIIIFLLVFLMVRDDRLKFKGVCVDRAALPDLMHWHEDAGLVYVEEFALLRYGYVHRFWIEPIASSAAVHVYAVEADGTTRSVYHYHQFPDMSVWVLDGNARTWPYCSTPPCAFPFLSGFRVCEADAAGIKWSALSKICVDDAIVLSAPRARLVPRVLVVGNWPSVPECTSPTDMFFAPVAEYATDVNFFVNASVMALAIPPSVSDCVHYADTCSVFDHCLHAAHSTHSMPAVACLQAAISNLSLSEVSGCAGKEHACADRVKSEIDSYLVRSAVMHTVCDADAWLLYPCGTRPNTRSFVGSESTSVLAWCPKQAYYNCTFEYDKFADVAVL